MYKGIIYKLYPSFNSLLPQSILHSVPAYLHETYGKAHKK